MNKSIALPLLMVFSFLFGDTNIQIRLQNGQKAQGEFVGTYMNHVHILVEEKIIYYACDDIVSITYADGGLSYGKGYAYDCSKNTVTADILFPPELDPMTGEWAQMLPDVFNLDIPKPAVEKATSVIQNPAAQVETGGVSATEDFVIIDGVKYAKVSPDKETARAESKLAGVRNNQVKHNTGMSAPQFNVCHQARLDAVASTSPLWYGGGIIYYVGVPAYIFSKPQPNQYAISNIAPEEQLLYMECYKTAAQNERGKRMALGCGGFLLFFMMTAGM